MFTLFTPLIREEPLFLPLTGTHFHRRTLGTGVEFPPEHNYRRRKRSRREDTFADRMPHTLRDTAGLTPKRRKRIDDDDITRNPDGCHRARRMTNELSALAGKRFSFSSPFCLLAWAGDDTRSHANSGVVLTAPRVRWGPSERVGISRTRGTLWE